MATPVSRSTSTLPLTVWTVSIILTYVVWYLRSLGDPWSMPGWVVLFEYGYVAVTAAAIVLSRRLTRPAVPQDSTDRPDEAA